MTSINRRELIALADAALPFAAQAQQSERVRRIGVIMTSPATDAELRSRMSAFREGLATLGWVQDRNLVLDIRYDGPSRNGRAPLRRNLSIVRRT
jgi:putative ABC transport system substrate-binding protein